MMGNFRPWSGNGVHKKGEDRFFFTFLRREISPAKVEQQKLLVYDCKLNPIHKKPRIYALNLCTVYNQLSCDLVVADFENEKLENWEICSK
jgi:hypothetical protein